MEREILMEVKHLKKYFKLHSKQYLRAVDDVSFNIYKGETLGIVGESGCGKTTCGRTCIGMYGKTDGEVLYRGKDVHDLKGSEKKRVYASGSDDISGSILFPGSKAESS